MSSSHNVFIVFVVIIMNLNLFYTKLTEQFVQVVKLLITEHLRWWQDVAGGVFVRHVGGKISVPLHRLSHAAYFVHRCGKTPSVRCVFLSYL